MIKRRLLQLLEKLLEQLKLLHSSYRDRLTLSSDYQRRFSVIQRVLEQGKYLFAGKKVSDRIVSIDRHYLRPIIRGKEKIRMYQAAAISHSLKGQDEVDMAVFEEMPHKEIAKTLGINEHSSVTSSNNINIINTTDQQIHCHL